MRLVDHFAVDLYLAWMIANPMLGPEHFVFHVELTLPHQRSVVRGAHLGKEAGGKQPEGVPSL